MKREVEERIKDTIFSCFCIVAGLVPVAIMWLLVSLLIIVFGE